MDDPAADPEDAREDSDEKADDHTLPGVHVVDVSRAARVHDPPGAGSRRGRRGDPREEEHRDQNEEDAERKAELVRRHRAREVRAADGAGNGGGRELPAELEIHPALAQVGEAPGGGVEEHQRERRADGVRGREVVADEQQRDQEEAAPRADQLVRRCQRGPVRLQLPAARHQRRCWPHCLNSLPAPKSSVTRARRSSLAALRHDTMRLSALGNR